MIMNCEFAVACRAGAILKSEKVQADANANVPAQSGQPLIPAKCSGDNKERGLARRSVFVRQILDALNRRCPWMRNETTW